MVVYILQNTRASSSEAVDGAKNVFRSGVSMLGEGPSLGERGEGGWGHQYHLCGSKIADGGRSLKMQLF
jgi:hypothetical protein